jgi:hypothetical protein
MLPSSASRSRTTKTLLFGPKSQRAFKLRDGAQLGPKRNEWTVRNRATSYVCNRLQFLWWFVKLKFELNLERVSATRKSWYIEDRTLRFRRPDLAYSDGFSLGNRNLDLCGPSI